MHMVNNLALNGELAELQHSLLLRPGCILDESGEGNNVVYQKVICVVCVCVCVHACVCVCACVCACVCLSAVCVCLLCVNMV